MITLVKQEIWVGHNWSTPYDIYYDHDREPRLPEIDPSIVCGVYVPMINSICRVSMDWEEYG